MGRATDYASPVVPIDFPWRRGDQIQPCTDCMPWSVEFIPDHPEYGIAIREWHAVGCLTVAAACEEV